jgi:hypothetical protein
MDLAHYAGSAVLVLGRSVRDVAAATGRSKSWVLSEDGTLLRHLTLDPNIDYQSIRQTTL